MLFISVDGDTIKRDTSILALVLLLIFASALLNAFIWSGGGGYIFRFYQTPPVITWQMIYNSLFSWSNLNYSGYPNIIGGVLSLPVLSIYALVESIAGLAIGGIIVYALEFSVGGIGIFLLVYEFTKRYGVGAYMGAFLASLTFIIHPFVISNDMAQAICLPYVFLFGYLLIRDLEKNKSILLNFALLALSLAFELNTVGEGDIIQTTLFLSIVTLVVLIASKKRMKILAVFLAAALLASVINISWIVSTYSFVSTMPSQFFNQGSYNYLVLANNYWGLAKILFGFGYLSVDPAISPRGATLLLGEAIGFIILFAIAFVPQFAMRKRNSFLKDKILVALLVGLIVLTTLSNVSKLPFGSFVDKLILNVPYLLVLRSPYLSLYFLYAFIFSVFIGVGFSYLSWLISRPSKHTLSVASILFVSVYINRKHVLTILSIFLAFVCFIYLYSFYYLPARYVPQEIVFNKIPEGVFNVSNYINGQNGSFAVATLPGVEGLTLTRSYFAFDLFPQLIDHPVYTGAGVAVNPFFYPGTLAYYDMLAYNLSYGTIPNISDDLGTLGIRYIIVETDEVSNTTNSYAKICVGCGVSNFDLSRIIENLNSSNSIVFVNRYGNDLLYKDNVAVPLVYALNSSSARVTFDERSPTDIRVNITNATVPFLLVFRETYDRRWAAYWDNGTEITQADHEEIEGFANAWYINRTGSYTITLYYKPQTTAWVLLSISIIGFVATIVLLVLGVLKDGAKINPLAKVKV